MLLHASDQSSAHHDRARSFLRECTRSTDLLCLAWVTLMGYVRIATHPAIFERPLPHEAVVTNIRGLIAFDHVRVLAETEGFLSVYTSITGETPIRGNLVPDAHLAAVLLQHGVATLYTRDRDFRKFDRIDARDPFG